MFAANNIMRAGAKKFEFIGTEVLSRVGGAVAWNFPLPVGSEAGDRAIYGVGVDASTRSVTSNGGADTTLRAYATVNPSFAAGMWSKVITSTDVSNGYVAITLDGNAQGGGFIGVWRDSSAIAYIGIASGTGSAAALLAGTGTDDYFGAAWLDDDLTTVSSWPASYTEGRNQGSSGSGTSGGTMACAVARNANPGAESFTFGSSDAWFTLLARIS